MKRLLAVALALAAFPSPAGAEVVEHWSVVSGVTASTHAIQGFNNLQDQTKSRTGFQAGVSAEWSTHRYLRAVSQATYVQKGAGLEWMVTDYEHPLGTGKKETAQARVDYLSVTIAAKAVWPSPRFSPYVVLGPRLDVLVGHTGAWNSFDAWYDHFTRQVLGLSFGAGVEVIRLLPTRVCLESRYHIDVTDSFDVHAGMIDYRIRNSSVDVTLIVGLN